MSLKYLIDENLPSKISLWQSENFIHVRDIADSMDDSDILRFAFEKQYTVITKDADFRNYLLAGNSELYPHIILLGIGNMKLKEFEVFLNNQWTKIANASIENKIVIVHLDFIESL